MVSWFRKAHPHSISRDMLALALLNGLSSMALNGAAIFGMLAVLSGHYFVHGLTGLGLYILAGGLTTFAGYAGVCLLGARYGMRQRTALFGLFGIHAIGFIAAALIHPAFVSISAGFGLGMFSAVFMLRNINDLSDKTRDSYATLYGIIQQIIALIAPVLGATALYVGTKVGLHDPFFPAFLVFACSVLMSLPLIRLMPNGPLPFNVKQPLRKIFARNHVPSVMFFIATMICDSCMNPLLIITSYVLLGHPVDVGWFTALVAVLAAGSLFFSRRIRLTGQRWVILWVSLLSIGISFAVTNLTFEIPVLFVSGVIFAIARANYGAAWFATCSRVMEHEWAEFGKNRGLILGEMCFLTSRMLNTLLILACGSSGMSLRASLGVIAGYYIIAATAAGFLARFLDRRHRHQMTIIV